jgi:putative Holliday junction resolvase
VVVEATADAATVLAFDFGTRRIGVAIGNTVVRIAHPLTTIAPNERRALRGDRSADRPVAARVLVVGCRCADGTEHEMTARAERFARQLEGRFRLPVVRADERYTTRVADSELSEAGVRGMARRAARDAAAARLILQGWFDDEERVDARGPA